MDTQPSTITPDIWRRLLSALDAGAPPHAACRYAGISPSVWERERQRVPEFGVAADQVETSGLVAAWRFLQVAAASEWRASLELIKLFGATRGREAARLDEQGHDPDAEISPDDVAAVVRILHAHGLSDLPGAVEGQSNGRHGRAAANAPGEAIE